MVKPWNNLMTVPYICGFGEVQVLDDKIVNDEKYLQRNYLGLK